VPMEATMKNILNAVVIICVVLWLVFGVFGLGGLLTVPVPRVGGK
jgi:hypothetical protein